MDKLMIDMFSDEQLPAHLQKAAMDVTIYTMSLGIEHMSPFVTTIHVMMQRETPLDIADSCNKVLTMLSPNEIITYTALAIMFSQDLDDIEAKEVKNSDASLH
jgi:hypothetical protein